MKRRLAVVAGIVGALSAMASCEDRTRPIYDSFDGEAYPNRRAPVVLPAGRDLGFVTNSGSDTIDILDLENGTRLDRRSVGRDPIGIDGPHHLAVDLVSRSLFTALSYPPEYVTEGPHQGHGGSVRSGFLQWLSLEDFRPLAEIPIEQNPGDIVMTDDGAHVVVSHFDLKRLTPDAGAKDPRAQIYVLDPKNGFGVPKVRHFPLCRAPHSIALSRPDGKDAYVACYGDDTIANFSLTDPARAPTFLSFGTSGGIGPYALALSPSQDLLAVASTEAKDVRIISRDTFSPKFSPISVDGAAFFPLWSDDESTLFVPVQAPDRIVVIDAANGSVRSAKSLANTDCVRPHELSWSTDRATLYAVCEGDHRATGVLAAFDSQTLERKSSTDLGVYPDRMVIRRIP